MGPGKCLPVLTPDLQEMRKENDVKITDSELQEKYAEYIQNQLNYYEEQKNSTEK